MSNEKLSSEYPNTLLVGLVHGRNEDSAYVSLKGLPGPESK